MEENGLCFELCLKGYSRSEMLAITSSVQAARLIDIGLHMDCRDACEIGD